MADLSDKLDKLFRQYITGRSVLIADPNASARAGLARALVDMGAKAASVHLATNIDVAKAEIERLRPHVVISEFGLGKACGLDLLQSQRQQRPTEAKECLFVLVTGNTSQAAVARAAEEDVDMYLLKPYTMDVLRQSIIRAAISKVHPSDYVKTVEEGKKLLMAGKPQEAIPVFEKAMTLDPKPSLACFYHGQSELFLKAADLAESDYNRGLTYNKIHYKCLVGLYELFMSKGMHAQAYDIIKRLSRYFPANPARLTQVLRLAVLTQSYEDIERYYQLFKNMDQRTEELVKYMCAALLVCGKFYLKSNSPSRAIELLQNAAVTSAGRSKILREIIQTLVAADMSKEAQEILKRFPPDARKEADYLSMEYLILDRTLAPGPLLDIGRRLLKADVHDPAVYRILIKRELEVKHLDTAENLAQDAARRWPEQSEQFLAPLKEAAGAAEPAAKPAEG